MHSVLYFMLKLAAIIQHNHMKRKDTLTDMPLPLSMCNYRCVCLSVGGCTGEGADTAGHRGTAGAKLRGEPNSSAGERRAHRETGQEGEGAGGCRAEVSVFISFSF